MSLDVGDALREGASRTTAANGLLLMTGFAAVAVASLVAQHSYLSWAIEEGLLTPEVRELMGQNPAPMAVGVPVAAALGLWAGTAIVAEGLRIVAIRTFVSRYTDRIPAVLVTRRLGWAVLNGFVGTVLVNLLIVLGSVLFVVPGVFLALSLFFVRQEIAVEDVNFVEAMANSWDLARGNRVELAVLAVVWITLAVGLWIVGGVIGVALSGAPAVAAAISVVLGAPLTVFGVAVGARAYVQLTDGRDEPVADDGTEAGGQGDEAGRPDGEDDEEEWPDPPGLELRSRAA